MNNSILIPEHKLNHNYKYKVFINENSKNLNLIYSNKNDTVIKYLDLNRNNRLKESKYLENVTLKVIEILRETLNEIHKENHSKRYWEIILRPWLNVFIYTIRNRYRKIQFILNKRKNIYFLGNFLFNKYFIPQDTKHFHKLHCSNDWNNYIYFKIFKHLSKKNILKNEYKINTENTKYIPAEKKSFKHRVDSILKYIDFGFNKTFVHSSGMSFLNEFMLNLSLFQIPRFYYEESLKNFSFNSKLRTILSDKLNNKTLKTKDSFLNFLINVMPDQLPFSALEGYKYCKVISMNQKYPKDPKVIFTSNSFYTNEMFKFYTAQILDKNNSVKYIIGQHGNNYNTNIFNKFLPEITTSDFFLNWGVKKNKQISFCNFISKKEKYFNVNRKYLLIVLRSLGEKRTLFDQELHNKYSEDYLIKFLSGLDLHQIKNVFIKPHFTHDENSIFFKKINLNFPQIKILNKNFKISKIFKKCKLIIYNYDGTSYLQLLSSNFPTIAFWPGKDRHLIDEVRPIYKSLKKNSLWSDDPLYVSKLVNKNWYNIYDWWHVKKRQYAISLVKKKLCKPRNFFFIFDLAKIISSYYYEKK